MSQLLTLQDVGRVETACLTAGDHAAFTPQAMLQVLRSYRQAISTIRAMMNTQDTFVKQEGGDFLKAVDAE